MIRSTARPSFATNRWDATTGGYPARPNADLVRWVGPVQPARSQYQSGDEWRSYNVAHSPVELGGCILWLDAGQSGYADNTTMTDWPSVVGPSGTAVGTPVLNTTGTTKPPNGTDVVVFDGSTDCFTLGTGLTSMQWNQFTVVSVAACDVTSGEHTILSNDALGYNGDLLFGINPHETLSGQQDTTPQRPGVSLHGDAASRVVESTSNLAANTFRAFGVRYDNAAETMEWWEGTSLVASTTSLSSAYHINPAKTWNVGRNPNSANYRWFDGNIAEVIVFDRCLSAVEMESLLLYLTDKHGV